MNAIKKTMIKYSSKGFSLMILVSFSFIVIVFCSMGMSAVSGLIAAITVIESPAAA